MVKVKYDLGISPTEFLCIFHSAFCHIAEKGGVGIVACAFGNLKDNGGFLFSRSLDDGLELLHVVEVERGDSISASDGLLEHLAGVNKAESLIIYHFK